MVLLGLTVYDCKDSSGLVYIYNEALKVCLQKNVTTTTAERIYQDQI